MASDEASSSSSSTKVRKCHGQEAVNDLLCKDRISTLPDAILGDILSSFSTKQAVCSTSVLSKRWRYVWTSVPRIYIDAMLCTRGGGRNEALEFADFVDRVLRLNGVSPLEKFWFRWSEDYSLPRFGEWMSNVANRDVNDLDLIYSGNPLIEVPPCVFTCKKLVNLKLFCDLFLNVPQSAFLPSLKVLHLYLVQFFDDDNSLKNLLAGCPVLEELILLRRNPTTTLHIQSSSLKSLRLITEVSHSDGDLGIVLDAKNLDQINITDYVTKRFYIIGLSSVVSVSLDVCQEDTAVELLRKMCKTKYLNVSYKTMRSLKVVPLHNFPVFCNLSHLVVQLKSPSWAVLPYLLECSRNLRTFEIQVFSNYDNEVEFHAPKCLMLHLESINIFGFDWSKNEMEMVSYFLKKSIVLKKMCIHPINEESNLCKELCMLPKSSIACKVEILSYNCAAEINFPFY